MEQPPDGPSIALAEAFVQKGNSTLQHDPKGAEEEYKKANEQYLLTEKLKEESGTSLSALDYSNWGYVLAKLSDDKAAIKKYEEAEKINPDFARAHLNWGNALVRAKDDLGAIEQYSKAAKDQPPDPDQDRVRADAHHYWGSALERLDRVDEALDQYRQATETNPNDPTAWNDWGNLLLKQKRFEEAEGKFKMATSLDKASAPYRGNLAYVLGGVAEQFIAAGKYREACSKFVEAMNQDLSSVNYAKWVKALELLDDGRAGVEAEADAAIRLASQDPPAGNPHPAAAYNAWGQALAARFKFNDALQKYRNAENLLHSADAKKKWPLDLADAIINQGWVRLSQFKRAEAITLFQKATKEIAPNYSQGWTALAAGLGEDKQFQEAIKACERAWRESATEERNSKSSYYVLWTWGNILTACGRRSDAVAKFEESARAEPRFPYSWHNIAAEDRKVGRYARSRNEYLEALRVYGDAKEAYRNDENAEFFGYYGGVLAELEQFDKAEKIFKEGLELNSNHPGILVGLTNLYLAERNLHLAKGAGRGQEDWEKSAADAAQDYWKAREFYAKAKDALTRWRDLAAGEPGDWLTELKLGELELAFEFYDSAKTHLLSAAGQNTESAEAQRRLGALFVKQKDLDKAERCFQEALKLEPENLSARNSLANVYLNTNKLAKARTEYQAVLRMAPDHVDALSGLADVYTSLGDQGDEAIYEQAIRQFDKALRRGESGDASKTLHDKDKAAIYYSRGYAKSQQYSKTKSLRLRGNRLNEAREDFQACLNLDPDHYRAGLAARKIEERLKQSAPGLLEQWGPWFVVLVSLGVLLLVQLNFYFRMFGEAVSEGAYSGVTFGAIALMIAGFFLPVLTKLKVPGIDLEKGVSEQIVIDSPLNISRGQGDLASGPSGGPDQTLNDSFHRGY